MRRHIVLAALVLAGSASLATAAAKQKRKRHIPFSDAAVSKAIERGRTYLLSRQQGDGSWRDPGGGGLHMQGNDQQVGGTGLFTYALLTSGLEVKHAKVAKALAWLEKQRTGWTYGVSLRSQAWMAAAKKSPGQAKYRRLLIRDASALIKAAFRGRKPPGSYTYRMDYQIERDERTRRERRVALSGHDPSNGQYGVLGVWAAHQMSGEVPRQYWSAVMKYWLGRQQVDGGWKYHDGDKNSTGTMTTAGVATLFVCVDALLAQRFIRCQRTNDVIPLRKGMAWFDRNFPQTLYNGQLCHGGHGGTYYYLFGVERVGLASGYKYFGKADWYKMGATWLLNEQLANGSWKGRYGAETSTAYALLFLSRGQHGVLFNRLEYEGDWNNRPRALANLCRWAHTAFEKDVYWQIVNLRVDVSEWRDAPILVITGSLAPKLSDGDLGKLRQYVHQGGTILSIAECDDKAFQEAIRQVYAKLFGGRELKDLPTDHPLYTHYAKIPKDLKVSMISNGARPWAIHTDTDVARDWQLNRRLSQKASFDLAANVAMYVTGKQLHNRGANRWPDRPKRRGGAPAVKIAPLRHGGDWQPEPLAWERLTRRVGSEYKVNVELGGPVAVGEAASSGATIATLTGTGRLALSAAETAALKTYVEGGGLLLIDAAGGSGGGGGAFAESAEAVLRELFGRRALRTLSTESELYKRKGYEIDRAHYHLKTRVRLGSNEPRLKAVLVDKRIGVLFSRQDLTIALLGCSPVGCDGYTPKSAYEIVRNVILYAAEHAKR